MGKIKIDVEGEIFIVNKELLCEHSDYFRAMFCGNYAENKKLEVIFKDVIDLPPMRIIIQYMTNGFIDLSEYDLFTVGEIARCAKYLQMSELVNQINNFLEARITYNTWLRIAKIAEEVSLEVLKNLAVTYGLLWFKYMSPDDITTMDDLFWYVSHPYLNVENEYELFRFVYTCLSDTVTQSDCVLIALACLDLEKVTYDDLRKIRILIRDYSISKATQVVECLFELSEGNFELTTEVLEKQSLTLTEMFTEDVYEEVFALVKANNRRLLRLTPTVPMWAVIGTEVENVPNRLYTFTTENSFEEWIEVAETKVWGWSVIAWGLTKIVVVGGERGKGTGSFVRDIKVYDTLKKEWIHHGVELPNRRHTGLAIVGNSLFIIGGVGGFRVILDTVLLYDLINRSFREVAKLPDAIQAPAVCVHEGSVYMGGHKNIYKYEDRGANDTWTRVLETDIRNHILMSFKGYIYCTQQYFCDLYRFKPDIDNALEKITYFSNPPAAICNLGDRLFFFTTMGMQSDVIAVEEYQGKTDEKPKVLWSESNPTIKVKDFSGSCTLLVEFLPKKVRISDYAYTYMIKYATSLDELVENEE